MDSRELTISETTMPASNNNVIAAKPRVRLKNNQSPSLWLRTEDPIVCESGTVLMGNFARKG
ncbi:hypothetical protein [Propionivibrio sp.]|uniref:hypothetical protein n=1 Tax=Propionivibrio sp. TaxID=2212460 RepID=UPI0025F8F256|nr:hypothetical protein [Propionivibrio sp.]